MFQYKLSDRFTKESLEKLVAQIPAQAGAVLIATYELGGTGKEVSEADIVKHIKDNLQRLSPRARSADVVDGFVQYYRRMLKQLPQTLLVMRNDGTVSENMGRAPRAEFIVDPFSGENIANVFDRKKKGTGKSSKPTMASDDPLPELRN